MRPDEVEAIFREAGALLEGHFVLASGRHSARYLEKFRVFERPRLTERLCAAIVERVRGSAIDAVAGPTTGGILIAHEVARQLGTRALYAEREQGKPGRAFRRGQKLRRGERVLVVDDILTTGGSLRETIEAARTAGAEVVAAAVLVDRSGGIDLGAPFIALWTTAIESHPPKACPLCAAGGVPVKPGTTDHPRGRGPGGRGPRARSAARSAVGQGPQEPSGRRGPRDAAAARVKA